MLDGNVPAVVRRTSWKEYSVLISIPECLVDVLVIGEGTAERRSPFRYISRERSLAVASLIVGHSKVTEVWVTLRAWSNKI